MVWTIRQGTNGIAAFKLMKSRVLAVKTAGSLMLSKLVRQCGSVPRVQYSDDVLAFCSLRG